MTRLQKQLIALRHHEDGAATVEFAIIAPVFLFMLLGAFDIGHSVYMRSVLDGAVQKAARDSALESGPTQTSIIDEKVTRTVKKLSRSATLEFKRESYFEFNDVDRAELFADTNGDGECNNGETFEDENFNEVWDEDVGETGIGGPKDIVQYTVTVKYPAVFAFSKSSNPQQVKKDTGYKPYEYFSFKPTRVMSSTTVLKNQPYGQQGEAVDSTPETCE
jgi:Flp pilus assembly protein TadG